MATISDHFGIEKPVPLCERRGWNPGHLASESNALPTSLPGFFHYLKRSHFFNFPVALFMM